MKKFLSLAILLLTLLAVNETKAQNYSSELGGTCGIWCRAMNSDADIYTEVYDSDYDVPDYSQYGDFTHEVHYVVNDDSAPGEVSYFVKVSPTRTEYYDCNGTFLYSEELLADKDGGWLDEVECDGRAKTYCPWCGAYIYLDEWNEHNCQSLIPPYFPAEGTGGGGGGGGTPGNGNGKGEATIGALPTSGRISVSNFLSLMKHGVHIAKLDMPKSFHEQTLKYECVVRGIANMAQLMGKDYNVAYQVLSKIASDAGYELDEDGILDKNIHKLFNNYVTLIRNPCTEDFINNQIDNHNNVLVTIWTEDGPHMVTVLGYDADNYYCAAGFSDVDIINKDWLDKSRSAFTIKQFNGAFK